MVVLVYSESKGRQALNGCRLSGLLVVCALACSCVCCGTACSQPDRRPEQISRETLAEFVPFQFGWSVTESQRECPDRWEEVGVAHGHAFLCEGMGFVEPFDKFDVQLVFCRGLLCGMALYRYAPEAVLPQLYERSVEYLRVHFGSPGAMQSPSERQTSDAVAGCDVRPVRQVWLSEAGDAAAIALFCVGGSEHLVVQYGNPDYWGMVGPVGAP